MNNKERLMLMRRLFEIGAVNSACVDLRVKDCGGSLSDYEIGLAGLALYQEVLRVGIRFQLVAAVPTRGRPFAKVVSQLSGKPLVQINKIIDNGRFKMELLHGDYGRRGRSVLFIDDSIKTGDSVAQAMIIFALSGFKISGLGVLIDMEEGGSLELIEEGYSCLSVFRWSEIVASYNDYNRSRISKRGVGQ